jgi:FAD/FMN-containing dehydrogenase
MSGLDHDAKVTRLQDELRRAERGRPLRLHKRAVSHKVPVWRKPASRQELRLDNLDQILSIDPVSRTCVAEPGVSFDKLVEETGRHGLAPIIVPELKTITIGGAVAGCSIESTSYKNGGFHDTCLEYEVLSTTGDRLICTPNNEHQLVFQMMHGTFGTLGVLTRLKFKLMPVKRYVHVAYEHHSTLEAYLAAIQRHFEARDVEFMDGMIHSRTRYTLSLGECVNEAPYTHSYDWYRVYPDSVDARDEDYLRTADYFFRYDHGVTRVHPSSFAMRLLFGKLFGSTQLLRLAHKFPSLAGAEHDSVTQDLFLPFSRTAEFIRWFQGEYDFYPIWVVPYARVRDYEWASGEFYRGMKDPLFIDLGIYGLPQRRGKNEYRVLEEKLKEVNGMKTLISCNFYSEDEFWSLWNKETYSAVKRQLDPDGMLDDLYAKMCRKQSA